MRILIIFVGGILIGGLSVLFYVAEEIMLLREILRNNRLRALIEEELFDDQR